MPLVSIRKNVEVFKVSPSLLLGNGFAHPIVDETGILKNSVLDVSVAKK